MNLSPAQAVGSFAALAGGVVGAQGIGNLAEQIGAIVALVAGIIAAWYASKQKVNAAQLQALVSNAQTAAETWQTLAEGREATIAQRDTIIHSLGVDKENLRHELAKSRERIAALEARPAFEDVTHQNEQHHQENLAHFQTLIELMRALVAANAGSTTVNVRPEPAAT